MSDTPSVPPTTAATTKEDELESLLAECWSEGTNLSQLGERFMKHIVALRARLVLVERQAKELEAERDVWKEGSARLEKVCAQWLEHSNAMSAKIVEITQTVVQMRNEVRANNV